MNPTNSNSPNLNYWERQSQVCNSWDMESPKEEELKALTKAADNLKVISNLAKADFEYYKLSFNQQTGEILPEYDGTMRWIGGGMKNTVKALGYSISDWNKEITTQLPGFVDFVKKMAKHIPIDLIPEAEEGLAKLEKDYTNQQKQEAAQTANKAFHELSQTEDSLIETTLNEARGKILSICGSAENFSIVESPKKKGALQLHFKFSDDKAYTDALNKIRQNPFCTVSEEWQIKNPKEFTLSSTESFYLLGFSLNQDQLFDAIMRELEEVQSPCPEKLKKVHQKAQIHRDFQNIDSSKLQPLPFPAKFREDILARKAEFSIPPAAVSYSHWIPKELVEHLMHRKKDSALRQKYVKDAIDELTGTEKKDEITNMEGLLHTYVTPVCSAKIFGDFKHGGVNHFPNYQCRPVILSAAVHPDFEYGANDGDSNKGIAPVMMRLCCISEEEIQGEILPSDFRIISPEDKNDNQKRAEYDQKILKHAIYHLTSDHKLPSLKEAKETGYMMSVDEGRRFLEELFKRPFNPAELKRQFVNFVGMDGNDQIISLEVLYNSYVQQIRNEFSVLEAAAPQGYVYTIDPPGIFVHALGGPESVAILNRLQGLALKNIHANSPLNNLKVVGFNNYSDEGMVDLLKKALPDKDVKPKKEVFDGQYKINKNYALVLHNNSDGFGQNIETEGGRASLDALIGNYSTAAIPLARGNKFFYV